jgi:hypothetical protein
MKEIEKSFEKFLTETTSKPVSSKEDEDKQAALIRDVTKGLYIVQVRRDRNHPEDAVFYL